MLSALEGHRLEVPVALMLFLGLRRGELLGLRWDDVDLVRGLVTVRNNLVRVGKELQLKSPKTEDSSRTLSLSGPMLSLLKLYKWLFCYAGRYLVSYVIVTILPGFSPGFFI